MIRRGEFARLNNCASALAIFICFALIHFSPKVKADIDPGEVCETRSIMTLAWTICLFDNDKTPGELRRNIAQGMDELNRIDQWMSEWKPDSLVSKINKNAGIKPVEVTDEAFAAIEESLKESERTDGAFDITFNAFFGLYSWKPGQEHFPSDEQIKRLLPLVNYKNVVLDKDKKTVFLKNPGMKIGLGGMGEGWAVDKVYELLRPKKIKSGFIDGSGAVRVWGIKPNGKKWVIAVGDPRPMTPDPNRKATIYNIYTTDIAVTTAGDTEKSFYKNGRLYHHIIDPKTGYSAEKSVQVTCICKTATQCDLADDGVFILGPQKGKAYAEKIGISCLMVDPEKHISFTTGLKIVKTQWGESLEFPEGK